MHLISRHHVRARTAAATACGASVRTPLSCDRDAISSSLPLRPLPFAEYDGVGHSAVRGRPLHRQTYGCHQRVGRRFDGGRPGSNGGLGD